MSEKTEKKKNNNVETEAVFYAILENEQGLRKAESMESHEQWEIKAPKGGRIRVRKITKPNLEPVYEMTIKIKDRKHNLINSSSETTTNINLELFEQFKSISDRGMVKDRYKFKLNKIAIKSDSGIKEISVPNCFFEVDAFIKPDAQKTSLKYYPYVKIDLELDPIIDELAKNHPDIKEFKLSVNTINLPIDRKSLLNGSSKDEVTIKKIDELYETTFIRKE